MGVPLVANYYLTYRCNARCHFCDIWALEPKKEADFETIKKNLHDLKRLGVKYIDFTGVNRSSKLKRLRFMQKPSASALPPV